MPRTILVVVGSLSVHWLLCSLVASPWWIPDLTLLAVVLVIAASPSRWWLAAGLAGLLTMCWTIQFPAVVMLWYGTLGLTIKSLSRVWDLADLRVQLLLVGMAETLWIALHLWLQDAWLFPLVALLMAHVGLTVLMVPMGRRLLAFLEAGC